MKHIKALSIQDISCYGQCSLTVALPILSSLGIETAILPTAILSTHTSGFKGFTFRDLKDDLPLIFEHWKKENVSFDAVYTGYLGHAKDVEVALSIAQSPLNKGPLIVDPAFGDHGVLYGGFDEDYVAAMRPLCAKADVLLPNMTEACFLLGEEYIEHPNDDEIKALIQRLLALGPKAVVLKGIGASAKETGFVYADSSEMVPFVHPRLDHDFHGTGDVFASAFVGGKLRGLSSFDAGVLAAKFTYSCINNTMNDEDHWYGVHFEALLPELEKELLAMKGEK